MSPLRRSDPPRVFTVDIDDSTRRRGGVTVLLLLALVAVTFVCMMTVNIAYIEMARTDLQTATDLSAKAAAQTLGETQNRRQALQTLRRQMRRHKIYSNHKINFESARFGSLSAADASGRMSFVDDPNARAGDQNAMRITGSYPTLFGQSHVPFPVMGQLDPIRLETTVARTDVDMVLCVDRSASMAWDLSGTPFQYPNATKGLDNYFRAPQPASRWWALHHSVDLLHNIIAASRLPGEVRLGLVSFASDYEFGVFESKRATVDVKLTDDTQAVIDKIAEIGGGPIIGDTNITAGLKLIDRARNQGKRRNLTGQKVMVLLSDGLPTQGGSPIEQAEVLAGRHWTIHTISLSRQADQELMTQIATIGGGRHFYAPDGPALEATFREIAYSLPGTLVD